MKIRNGFVSNSSSSSFVVAFPKKPKSFDDVYEAMFNSKDGGISVYDYDGMSHNQIAMRVWEDIKREIKDEWDDRSIPAKQKDIQEEFSHRYHYYAPDSCCSIFGSPRDEIGGQWSGELGKYYGNDKDSLIKLRDHIIKSEKREREIHERQYGIKRSEFKVTQPPYAYKGGKHSDDGKPYTAKEIKAYRDYRDAEAEFEKNHEEYAKLEKELRGSWDKKYKTQDSLKKKIAKSDAKAFMDDNKGAFFAILSYADENGETTLEHGNIFRKIPHVTISNH